MLILVFLFPHLQPWIHQHLLVLEYTLGSWFYIPDTPQAWALCPLDGRHALAHFHTVVTKWSSWGTFSHCHLASCQPLAFLWLRTRSIPHPHRPAPTSPASPSVATHAHQSEPWAPWWPCSIPISYLFTSPTRFSSLFIPAHLSDNSPLQENAQQDAVTSL